MLIYEIFYLKVIFSQFLFNIRDEKGRYIHLYEEKKHMFEYTKFKCNIIHRECVQEIISSLIPFTSS